MPKKKNEESQKKQFERFQKTVQDMADAGELSTTEADERFERAMDKIASPAIPQKE
jgi:guanylate kinase